MKKLIVLLLFLLPISAKATTTVTGSLKNIGTGVVTGNSFVRFWLRGCQGAQPRVNGTAVIAPSQGGIYFFDFIPDVNGNISGIVYSTRNAAGTGNGEIECPANTFTATFYGIQLFIGGKGGTETPVAAKIGATLNITNVTPLTATPVVIAPTGDTTYIRLDGGNSPATGTIGFSGAITYGTSTTPIATTLASACNGTVRGAASIMPGTYVQTTPLVIPSNCDIWWNGSKITSNGYNGDLVQLTSVSNVAFHGKLLLDGTNQGNGAVGQGINVVTSTNWSFEDIEVNKAHDACILLQGSAHIRGNRLYLTNCDNGTGSTSSGLTGQNSGTTPLTDVQIDTVDVNTVGLSDCVYISGTPATQSQRIILQKLDLQGCGDSAFEFNNTINSHVGQVAVGPNITNSGVLIRRGNTNLNVNSVQCASGLKICVDVANFLAADNAQNHITIGQVVATGENTDLVNGAAVRISAGAAGAGAITDVSFGQIVADASTRGFYCVSASGQPVNAHISVGNIITHNNKGDGIKLNFCNDVQIGEAISFDNFQGGTSDVGAGISGTTALDVYVGSARSYDDQGAGKTQKYGINMDSGSARWTAFCDCRDDLEVTNGWTDSGTQDFLFARINSSVPLWQIRASSPQLSLLGPTGQDARIEFYSNAGTFGLDLDQVSGGDAFIIARATNENLQLSMNGTGKVISNAPFNGTAYQTAANCAVNSVSPAACGSAASGAFVVPTTTTTYTVNTSAVTAASRIILLPMSFAGNLPSSPTCVAPAVTSAVTISAISAATSFTFALPSTTGQTCWQYWIVN